jgi:hypothetical protein
MFDVQNHAVRSSEPSLLLKKEIFNFSGGPRSTVRRSDDIKGPRVAEAAEKKTIMKFRIQLRALDDELKDSLRGSYLARLDMTKRDQQEFQCVMMGKLEKVLRHRIAEMGLDYRKYKIGGYERGTYERFFRVEPNKYMSKAQFSIAMNRCFTTDDEIKAGTISKLFDTFDLEHRDQMDWRLFLYLLTIMMMPSLELQEHLDWAYAIYASSGELDRECRDSLTLGTIKDILCVPVILSKRVDIRNIVDKAWLSLTMEDIAAASAAQRNTHAHINRKTTFGDAEAVQAKMMEGEDIDTTKLTHSLFQKLLKQRDIAYLMEKQTAYTVKDERPWTFRYEELFYHPVLMGLLRERRRINRNEDWVINFPGLRNPRKKRFGFDFWEDYVKRRERARSLIAKISSRWRGQQTSTAFDWWRELTMCIVAAEKIGRVSRGYIGRKKRDMMYKIQSSVTMIQAGTRKLRSYTRYKREYLKRNYGAMAIQRIARGFITRRRLFTFVQAKYDQGKLALKAERKEFEDRKHFVTATVIAMLIRRFLVRRRIKHRVEYNKELARLREEMESEAERHKMDRIVHKLQLEKWFRERKEEFERNRLDERRLAEQRDKIVALRRSNVADMMREKARMQASALERQEAERIELWLQDWDFKREKRAEERMAMCKRALADPDTPEEVQLAKDLRKRIKEHVKVVLRRADRQRIPMEIPEARELAELEILQTEVELERDRAREDQKKDAERILAEQKAKQAVIERKEYLSRQRRSEYSARKIQVRWWCLKDRKKLRKLAYARYKKYFDRETLEYFYEDKRSRKTVWKKPWSFGSYDIDCKQGWVVLQDTDGDLYYYNATTMDMQWEQPTQTVLCVNCKTEFAVARMDMPDNRDQLCDPCFNNRCGEMMGKGVDPTLIKFKAFKGNMMHSATVNFDNLDVSTYQHYLASTIAGVEMRPATVSADETGDQPDSRPDTAEAPGTKDNLPEYVVPKCDKCGERLSVLACNICQDAYCEPCFQETHEKPPWNAHEIVTQKRLAKDFKTRMKLQARSKRKARKRADRKFRKMKEEEEKKFAAAVEDDFFEVGNDDDIA